MTYIVPRTRKEADVEAAYVSALFGLGGAVVGGLASFVTSWSTQRSQFRAKVLEARLVRRAELFDSFIAEASRLYGDALSHEKDDISEMIVLYALVARMQLVASDAVVDAARQVMTLIGDTYLAPNRTLRELQQLAQDGSLDILVEFGDACRNDLRSFDDRRS